MACSVALVACGGGGSSSNGADSGAGSTVSKPAELSLVVGTIQTFNGTGANARLAEPYGIAIDSVGNTYITETGFHSVRKISPAGVVSVFAGDALNAGSADGTATAARFAGPGAIAVDKDDNIYVYDFGTIRKISPAGLVTTVAGSAGQQGLVDGNRNAARFFYVTSIAVDPTGGIFVWDLGSNAAKGSLRKIAVDGSVTTLAVPADTFRLDVYLAVDASGNLFIASGTTREVVFQTPNQVPVLHKLTPAGVLTQVYAFSKGDVDGGVFNFGGIAADADGNVYLSNNNFTFFAAPHVVLKSIGDTVLKLSPQGVLTTIAGTRGQAGFSDGLGVNARFNEPGKLAVDRQGNLVVADVGNGTIRTISNSGAVSTLAGRAPASIDGQGDKGQLKDVIGLASDQRGNVVVAERSAVRSLSPSGMLTTITTIVSPGENNSDVAVDSRGFVYVSNPLRFNGIDQYAPNGVPTGKTYAYASRLAVDTLDDLYGVPCCVSTNSIVNLNSGKTLAELGSASISVLTFDSTGNAYGTDYSNSVILKITPTGSVSVLAGVKGKPGYKDGPAGTAQFDKPYGIAVLGTDVYVADNGNHLIRKISQDGTVTTIAGKLGSLDTVMGPTGSLYRPSYLVAESSNSLLVVVDSKAIVRIRLQ